MVVLQYYFQVMQPFIPWIVLLGLFLWLLYVYRTTRENYGRRVLFTWLWHMGVLAIGWGIGRWMGIALISIPILFIHYYFSWHLAMVTVPFADPDSWQEWWQRFWLFFWYQWGRQYPVWAVPNSMSRKAEVRVEGELFGGFAPGLVWARSNQVVGLTTGLSFSGTRQAGTILTNPYERPFSVVDLRTQLRTSWIEVVSSDGIPYKALLFASFAVDKEKWSPSLYHQLVRANPLLKNAQEPNCVKGNYKFSQARMLALFNTMGVGFAHGPDGKQTTIEWDERVVFHLEKAASEVLSQRRLDELWQPQNEQPGVNAMDVIANAIKERCTLELRQHGVLLYSCRIVNFEFPKREVHAEVDDEIKRKHIAAWSADWQREADQTRAEGRAEADLLKQEARAYAYTNLLTAVAEGLQETRLLNPNLPRYVIAVRFISALERLIEEQPELGDVQEARTSLADAKKLLPWIGDMDNHHG